MDSSVQEACDAHPNNTWCIANGYTFSFWHSVRVFFEVFFPLILLLAVAAIYSWYYNKGWFDGAAK